MELVLVERIETARGLVEDKQTRAMHQRLDQPDFLWRSPRPPTNAVTK
jgi:hypothetical protein